MEKIYIIGHKSPDLDSVVSAIAYADFKNKLEGVNIYEPAIAGEPNKETKYILDRFGFDIPQKLNNLAGKKVILVDHNESSQSADGVNEAEILGILDHHKLNFSYNMPVEVKTLPWGSSCSIVMKEYLQNNIQIEKNLASIMLSAVLADTVITKSPTCTEMDEKIIEELSKISGISDWKELGMEIFKISASTDDLSAEEMATNDAKEFDFKKGKFFINQLNTADLDVFSKRGEEVLEAMKKLKKERGYPTIITFVTDIIKGGSKFLVITDDKEGMEKALGKNLDEEIYLEGVMSRKKQVVPMLSKIFDK